MKFLSRLFCLLCLPGIVWYAPLKAEIPPTFSTTEDYSNFSPWELLKYETLSFDRILDFVEMIELLPLEGLGLQKQSLAVALLLKLLVTLKKMMMKSSKIQSTNLGKFIVEMIMSNQFLKLTPVKTIMFKTTHQWIEIFLVPS